MLKKIAIIGIQGVPAHYGGFETLVENIIGENCSLDVEYTILCSARDCQEKVNIYKGARLKYIPMVHANGAQSTIYDILSMIRVINGYDAVVILGVSGCLFLPFFRLFFRKKLIVNIDGLEHKREKWGRFAKWFLRSSESMAVRFADVVIADNKGIQDYVYETYQKKAELIAYGGDHVKRIVHGHKQQRILHNFHLSEGDYAISVCRIEPENNCHITLEAFANLALRLVFIGNWNKSDYGRELKKKFQIYDNITMLDSIYDLDVLYVLRSNASYYIHGHSAGGTNPSLVEAMFFSCPILAYNVVYNRETTENCAYYFSSSLDIVNLLSLPLKGKRMIEIAEEKYTWRKIAVQYEALY